MEERVAAGRERRRSGSWGGKGEGRSGDMGFMGRVAGGPGEGLSQQ